MPLRQLYATTLVLLLLCSSASGQQSLQQDVDQTFDRIRGAAEDAGLTPVLAIDHARLASAEGVEMPPSRVQLFSDARLNTTILLENLRAGLDLPFRILSYAENGVSAVTYTSGAFIAQRHALPSGPLIAEFDSRIQAALDQQAGTMSRAAPTAGVDKDFAILELKSPFPVDETVARLKAAVTAQSDTIWFGDIDFQQQASAFDVPLAPVRLLLFGGPAPGGVAMADYPAIGLDAFCQKLLVYADEDGNAVVLYNDIAALAELHYGRSAEPHALLNKRLTETFTGAITR